MPDKEAALELAVDLVGKLLETQKGFDLLSLGKDGDKGMQVLGQRVKALAQALIETPG
jgi:hypothetical protein